MSNTSHTTAHRLRRRPFLIALIATIGSLVGIATVIALVVSVFVGNLARSFESGTATISDAFPTGERPAPSVGALNILLIGSDSRSHSGDGPSPDGGRSDTLMLAHIPADRKAVYLMSIMRDSWVDIPGHGTAKINAAYSWGGVPLTVQTVEQLLDIRIDHVAEIDFMGFKGMADALGGVTVESPRDFSAQGHHFIAGQNHLRGEAALAFVRARHPFADADHTRVQNQQAFMRGILNKVLSKSTLASPARLQKFVVATSEYLSVDASLDFQTISSLGWSLRNMRAADLHTFTVPTAGSGTSADGQSFVTVDTVAMSALSEALRSDTLNAWLAVSQR